MMQYSVKYVESDKESGIILGQNPKLKKVDSSIVVILYVSKKQEKDLSKDNMINNEQIYLRRVL